MADTLPLAANASNRRLIREETVHKIRVILGGLAALLLALAPQLAKAQDFPTRPVRIVVAFPPGGPTDFVGRLVADKMTKHSGPARLYR